jgi:hypothetical protein
VSDPPNGHFLDRKLGMLGRLFTTIRPHPLVAPAPVDRSPDDGSTAGGVGGKHRGRPGDSAREPSELDPAHDTVRRFRTLAECCSDGLTALAYAQFADLLEPPTPLCLRTVKNLPGTGATAVPVARQQCNRPAVRD